MGAGLVAGRRRDRVPPHPGQIVDLRLVRLDGDRARLDGQGRHRPDRGLRPRRRVAAGLVRPGRPAARPPTPAPDRRVGPERAAPLRRAPVTGDLPRPAGRADGGRRAASCASASIPIRRALPAGFSRGRRRRRAVRRPASSRPPARTPPRSSRTSPSSRRSARPGWPPSSGSGRGSRPDIPVVIDAKRGDIGSTAARQAVALFDGLGADAVTVNPYLGGEAIAPLLERADRFAYVLCRTSNPGAAEFQNLVVAADPAHRCAGRAAPPARRPARRDAGGRAARSAWSSARRRPAELRAIRAVAPGPRRSSSGGRRPGRRDRAGPARRAGDGGAGRRPATGGGLLVNVSRGISAAAVGDARRRRSARPRRASRGSRPRLGFADSLCYPSPRRDGPRGPITHAAIATDARPDRSNDDHAEHRTPELIIILVIALLILGPGKLPEVGAVARQEHQRVPQGVVGRPGRRQASTSTPRRCRPTPAPARRRRGRAGRSGRRRRRAVAAAPAPVAAAAGRVPPAPSRTAPPASASAADSTDHRRQLAGRPRPDHGRRRRPARAGRHRTSRSARSRAAARRLPPRPATSRSCRSSTTSASCGPACSGRSSRSRIGSAIGFLFATGSATSCRPPLGDVPLQVLGVGRRVRHPDQDRDRRRDHPGDAGPALPALGVRRARA